MASAGQAQSTVVATPVTLSSLVQAADGNYYGVTAPDPGGYYCLISSVSCGAIYSVSPAGNLALVHTLAGDGSEGFNPQPLVIGQDGNIYGMTEGGGGSSCNGNGCGTLFQITTAGGFQIVHTFNDAEIGSSASSFNTFSFGTPVLGKDGFFYEPAFGSGASLLYKISPTGEFHVSHVFSQAALSDGLYPNGLVQGTDGNFYGTTQALSYGVGTPGDEGGTVFRMTPDGTLTTLATFPDDYTPGVGYYSKGFSPGSLVEGPDGSFYGLTKGSYGVPNATMFRVTPTGQLQTMYTFSSPQSGFILVAPPIFGSDGNLYGAAQLGGDTTACFVQYKQRVRNDL